MGLAMTFTRCQFDFKEKQKMDKQKVDMFIMTNQKYFPANKIFYIKEKLNELSDDKALVLNTLEFKEPTTLLLVSIFLGSLGVDRFMLGDIGTGILKLLTGGLCGIMTIIDWFTISAKAKEANFTMLMTML